MEELGMHGGASPKIFQYARQLRANMTRPEKRLWAYLRNKPMGAKFRRQHPYGSYVLDFYCHKYRFCIEVDGQNHKLPEQERKDKERTKELLRTGLQEIRFSNEQVLLQFEEVQRSIRQILTVSANSQLDL